MEKIFQWNGEKSVLQSILLSNQSLELYPGDTAEIIWMPGMYSACFTRG